VQSAEKVMATVFWDVHGVLLVDFTPLSSTTNSAAYQETKETQGGYSAQETRIVDQRTQEFFCTTMLDLTVLPQL
jgi:hypothetical protein